MLSYDKAGLIAATNANAYSAFGVAGTPASSVPNAYDISELDGPTTHYIGSDFIELAGKRFDSKQLAYLLSKLLEEHPECQV